MTAKCNVCPSLVSVPVDRAAKTSCVGEQVNVRSKSDDTVTRFCSQRGDHGVVVT